MLNTVTGFRSKQAEFVAYIRDPDSNPIPKGIKKQRMAMYRELMFNNVEGFLANNFPVLRKILDGLIWNALAQDFFLKHSCQSPYFSEIAEEFLNFLQNEREPKEGEPDFLLELAHYEWVEMALSIATDQPSENSAEFIAQPMAYHLALSPLAWPLVYQYPVHLIAPDFQPTQAPATPSYLVVYRNSEFAVKFLEINVMTYRMLEIIQAAAGGINSDSCFQRIIDESGLDREAVIEGGTSILKNLATLGVVCQA